MLAKQYRIPRQSIDYILKKGGQFTSKLFIIRYKKNNENFCRYRTIISKKISLKAVKRNHLRRQVYESIRINTAKKSTPTCLDLILIAKKNILKADYQTIENDLKNNIHGEIQ